MLKKIKLYNPKKSRLKSHISKIKNKINTLSIESAIKDDLLSKLKQVNNIRHVQSKWDFLDNYELDLIQYFNIHELKAHIITLRCYLVTYSYEDRQILETELDKLEAQMSSLDIKDVKVIISYITDKINKHNQSIFYRPLDANTNLRKVYFITIGIILSIVLIKILRPESYMDFINLKLLFYGFIGIMGALIGEMTKWKEIPKSLSSSTKLSNLLIAQCFTGFLFGIIVQLLIEVEILNSTLFLKDNGKIIASLLAGFSEKFVLQNLKVNGSKTSLKS